MVSVLLQAFMSNLRSFGPGESVLRRCVVKGQTGLPSLQLAD
jgi:hypothetical protein